jgi:hypothetical protein
MSMSMSDIADIQLDVDAHLCPLTGSNHLPGTNVLEEGAFS